MTGLFTAFGTSMNAGVAVKMGFLAWGLLALSMGGIFLVVLILNRLGRKKPNGEGDDAK